MPRPAAVCAGSSSPALRTSRRQGGFALLVTAFRRTRARPSPDVTLAANIAAELASSNRQTNGSDAWLTPWIP